VRISVQIIENWSEVSGVVRTCSSSPDVAGFVAVEVAVEKVNPVEGFANLLGNTGGKPLVVLVPGELAKSLHISPGVMIACRVRRANLDRTFVHRNHISIHRSSCHAIFKVLGGSGLVPKHRSRASRWSVLRV